MNPNNRRHCFGNLCCSKMFRAVAMAKLLIWWKSSKFISDEKNSVNTNSKKTFMNVFVYSTKMFKKLLCVVLLVKIFQIPIKQCDSPDFIFYHIRDFSLALHISSIVTFFIICPPHL